MTLHVPLAAGKSTNAHAHTTTHTHISRNKPSANAPYLPPFVASSPTPDEHMNSVFDAILKAKRITVVCGAGISVEAGIPDFRSPDGLFQSLKRDNPKESLSSGKDLFDASVFKSTEKTALFCRMIASLASLSSQSEPTAFHSLLRTLDDRGQLLRVYTQNIDALEMKAGLSFGVPEFEERFLRGASRVAKAKGKAKDKSAGGSAVSTSAVTSTDVVGDGVGISGGDVEVEGVKKGKAKTKAKTKGRKNTGSGLYSYSPRKGKKKTLPSSSSNGGIEPGPSDDRPVVHEEQSTNHDASVPYPPLNTIPRCIPLHGTLLSLHCQHCTQTFPLHPPPSQPQSHTVTPPHSRSSSSSPDPSLPTPIPIDQNPTPQSRSPLTPTSTPTSPDNYTLHTLLSQGTPPPCPSCTSLEQTRALVGKRLRGVGKLRPSVVLYGEEHREGESVGEAVRRDLCGIEIEVGVESSAVKSKEGESGNGTLTLSSPSEPSSSSLPVSLPPSPIPTSAPAPAPAPMPSPTKPLQNKKLRSRTTPGKGPDLLLVVGTSLRVPGTKRIVREFSKAVRSLNSSSNSSSGGSTANTASTTTSPSLTPTPTPAPTPALATAHLPTPTPPLSDRETCPPCPGTTSATTQTQTPTPIPTPTSTPTKPRTSPSSKPTKSNNNNKSDRESAESKLKSKPEPIRTIYLNKEFPSPAREWEDVFDVWIQGDAQAFARGVAALIAEMEAEKNNGSVGRGEDEVGKSVKRKREREREGGELGGTSTPTPAKKRRKEEEGEEGKVLLTPQDSVRRPKEMKMKKEKCSAIASSSAWSFDEEEDVASSLVHDADMDVDIDVEEYEDCAIRTLRRMEMEKHSGSSGSDGGGGGVLLPEKKKNYPGSAFQMRRLSHLDVDVDVDVDTLGMEIVPDTESEAEVEIENETETGSGSGSASASGNEAEADWDRTDAGATAVPVRDVSCSGLSLQLQVSESRSTGYGRAYDYGYGSEYDCGYGYRREYGYGYNSPAPTPPPPPPLPPPSRDRRESISRRMSVPSVILPPRVLYSFGPSAAGPDRRSSVMLGPSSVGSFGSRSATTATTIPRFAAGVVVGADPFLVLDRDGMSPGVIGGSSFEAYREHQ